MIDDPMHPWPIPDRFRDWLDFVDQVARPIVEGDHKTEQAAMPLFRSVPPYYLCTALVMAANRLADTEARAEDAEAKLHELFKGGNDA